MLVLTGRTMLYVVADENTPNEVLAYAGIVIVLTPADLAALPVGPGDSIQWGDLTLFGYQRTVGNQLQWVLSPQVDPIVTMFNAIPGPSGWTVPAARDTWANTGQYLLANGVPRDAMLTGYPALFAAARSEVEHQHGL